MPPLPIPPPMKVSPTIKFFRWSLLIVGIFYGSARRRILAKKEVVIREIERQQKAIRDATIAEEKRIASERDIAMLAALAEAPKHDDEFDLLDFDD